jgi:N-acetylglucosaminyl-diphospho-decaprenol L-rhamnosyltransferase
VPQLYTNRRSLALEERALDCLANGTEFAASSSTALLEVPASAGAYEMASRPRFGRWISRPLVEIVIPVFNQLGCTQICLDSLRRDPTMNPGIVVVDNGSSDGTAEYLAESRGLTVISNSRNRGCAAAWNQGVRACIAEWIVVLNNDVVVTPGWLEGLLDAAEFEGLDIVTPAIREGLLNYDLDSYAREFVANASGAMRYGVADGVCFMVRRRVFERIGLFDETFRVGVFEDTDFFERARAAGFKLGMTGRSFIHHFGSVTQKCIRDANLYGPYEEENRIYFRKKWGLTQFKRWIKRFQRKRRTARWSAQERRQFGHTLYERWRRGRLVYS